MASGTTSQGIFTFATRASGATSMPTSVTGCSPRVLRDFITFEIAGAGGVCGNKSGWSNHCGMAGQGLPRLTSRSANDADGSLRIRRVLSRERSTASDSSLQVLGRPRSDMDEPAFDSSGDDARPRLSAAIQNQFSGMWLEILPQSSTVRPMQTLMELSSSVCAQGTRRRRLHLLGACDPGCAATREKTQSCSAMYQKRASHRHPSPPREHGVSARGCWGYMGWLEVAEGARSGQGPCLGGS